MAPPSGRKPATILRQIGELDADVGRHRVNAIRNRGDQGFQKSGRSSHIGAFDQLHEGELRGAVFVGQAARQATKRWSLPSAVLTSARSMWKKPIGVLSNFSCEADRPRPRAGG